MRLVLDRSQQVADWVSARIPQMQGLSFGPCAAIGVIAGDGTPLAGVVFHDHLPQWKSIQASFAADSPRWLTRRLAVQIMSYPFGQLDCQRVTTWTPKRNRPARKFIDAFGFKREGVIRQGFGDDDVIVSGMLKREWLASKWMQERPLSKSFRHPTETLDSAA